MNINYTSAEEYANIQSSAMNKSHCINSNKNHFWRRSKSTTLPVDPLIHGVERVSALRVLGMVISSLFTMGNQPSWPTIFLLRLLRLCLADPAVSWSPPPQLHLVARANNGCLAVVCFTGLVWISLGGVQIANGEAYCTTVTCKVTLRQLPWLWLKLHRPSFPSPATRITSGYASFRKIRTPAITFAPGPYNFLLPVKDIQNLMSRSLNSKHSIP